MVLVLAAGFAAVAQEDDRALMGTWENELTLDPNADDDANTFAAFDSMLSMEYTTGGISYSSDTKLSLDGLTEQEFGVDSSVGLLDLSSTLNMDVSGGNLRFWESSADMTLGGVSIGTTFYLQNHDWEQVEPGYKASFWPEIDPKGDYWSYPNFNNAVDGDTAPQTGSAKLPSSYNSDYVASWNDNVDVDPFHDYGSGLELTFSGETPGGVSVDVTNTFGMMPTDQVETDLEDTLDTRVLEDLVLDYAGESAVADLSKVTGNEALNWLESLMGPISNATATQAAKVLLVQEIGIGDYGDANSDKATISELVTDFNLWSADTTVTDPMTTATSGKSDEVRDAALDVVQSTVTIGGIAGETGKVVNTEFELGNVDYKVNVTEAADAVGAYADAYVDFVLRDVEVGPMQYGGSSLQYYSTLLEVDNLSLGCCDFSNETKFTEYHGFEYTQFDFSMAMETFPVDIDATLKWDNDPDTDAAGKTVTLTPSLSTDWSCFTVYSTLGSADGDIDSLSIDGFEISAELGHVKVTSITALDQTNGVHSLDSSYHGYDEVIAIDKLASAGELDFSLDLYTDIYNSSGLGLSGSGLAPEAIEGSASYPISSQFDLGSNLAWTSAGLQEVGLTLDYSF